MDEKVRENRLRRVAERRGLQLTKSRRRDPQAWDFGTYALVDSLHNQLVYGDTNSGYGKSLDQIEAWLHNGGETVEEVEGELRTAKAGAPVA